MILRFKKLSKKIRWGWVVLAVIAVTVFALVWQIRQMAVTAEKILQASLTNQTQVVEKTWSRFSKSWSKISPSWVQTLADCIGLRKKNKIRWLILLQNDKELRATGGFMGSFAQIEFENGGLKNIEIEDIYVPDGVLEGHIEPPAAIQQAFQHGTWRLPNSNWHPHFPFSSQIINWFFEKGEVEANDLLAAVNFTVLEDIFRQLQPIELTDYQTTVTAENLYLVTQSTVEKGFFPGSTQKKDFLNQLTKNLFFQIEKLNLKQKLKIIQIILTHLRQKNIQIYSQSEEVQNWILKMDWSGSLKSPSPEQDYLLSVDTNLGANKANCCTQRKVAQIIKNQGVFWEEKLVIEYNNQSVSRNPQPPENWGGDYKNYLRIFLPQQTKVKEVKIDGQILSPEQIYFEPENEFQLQSLGFFVNIAHQQSKKVEIEYIFPKKEKQKKYQLFVQKQSGISYEHKWQYENKNKIKKKEIQVEKDQRIRL